MSEHPMVLCENLVKIYKTDEIEVVALQGLDLVVQPGELMAIIGNSGSGKSTLLNMIGGLDKPSAGRLLVDGKDLVKMMLEGKGLDVIDLGVDVSPQQFIDTAKNEGCQIICCSALLTTTMGVMGEVVQAAKDAGIRDSVKIMVGGAPVTEAFCQQIGADKYTPDATTAADAAVALLANA